MVGLVLVSHSHALAQATLTLVRAMSGPQVPIAIAAGTGEDHQELGTDAMEIYAAIESLSESEGILILMDMGSAVLSTEMALDFLDDSVKEKVKLCPCSFVEGAVAAGVASKIGSSLDDVFFEASISLRQKEQHISTEISPLLQKTENLTDAQTLRVIIPNPQGLHARPAANLIQKVSKYESEIQIRNLNNDKGPVSARSMTGLISLEALKGNEVELIAKGEDAQKALYELKTEIEKGLGDRLSEPVPELLKTHKLVNKNIDLKPIGVSKGIVIGKINYPLSASLNILAIPENLISDPEEEVKKLNTALDRTNILLQQKYTQTSTKIGKEQAEIFKAQSILLKDPALVEKTTTLIKTQKFNAAWAWYKTIEKVINDYKNLNDKNLQQRALDLQDISKMVLEQLGIEIDNSLKISGEGIIIVEDITPNQVTTLDTDKVKGVICMENGTTSHSSILMRSLGIPAIVQAKRLNSSLYDLDSSAILAMNGETGEIYINPNSEKLNFLREMQIREEKKSLFEKQESTKPAITLDGKHIQIFANIGRKEDAEIAADNGAEGVGLFRTEFMFIEREQAPTEEEQVKTMLSILAPMKDKPIIIRTLDAGGDKNIPYLKMPKEDNPFLGVRAIRLSLRHPEMFQQQLKAILRIGAELNVKIMFPMIATAEELRQAKSELEKAHHSLDSQNIPHLWPISTGMMMEVPSAAIMAHEFIKEVDFISIGTNDLTQYTLASDRGNPELQETLGKGLDPSVIHLISHIVESCTKQGIPVAVCGESASQPEMVSVLLKLGINELSMNGRSIPQIKEWIRNQSTIVP